MAVPSAARSGTSTLLSSGAGGGVTPGGAGNDGPQENPHGSFVDLYFDRYVPELTAQQVRETAVPGP